VFLSKSTVRVAIVVVGVLMTAGSWGVAPAFAAQGDTERVSLRSDGAEIGGGASTYTAISGDGRYSAFVSGASDIVAGDTNSSLDVFVHDRLTGSVSRVSVGSDGTQGAAGSAGPSISADGRSVAFVSAASNLVEGDGNARSDVFVHDRQTGATTRISVSSDGDEGNENSFGPNISAGGRFVAFESRASNLVAGDTNGYGDIFVHDRQTGITSRVSVAGDGSEGNGDSEKPAISVDGRFVAFDSTATNLVGGDTNGYDDVFVHDRATGATTRVSVSSDGTQGDGASLRPDLTANGRHVVFNSAASNLVGDDSNGYQDVFVHDRETGVTTMESDGADGGGSDGHSSEAVISDDGRYVAYYSSATNLVANDTNGEYDIFVRDRQTGVTTRVSVSESGAEADSSSEVAAISADGRFVAFASDSANLVPGDTNGLNDVFVHQYLPDPPSPVTDWFVDDDDSVFENAIDKIARAGITAGCNPPKNDRFCPGDHVTRGQMAAFLVRALGYSDDGGGGIFDDTVGTTFELAIDRLATAGVTVGCNPPDNDRFCPDDRVTRGQMAAFLVRALGFSDEGGGDLFVDDDESVFELAIDRLGTAGVTVGCNPPDNDRFCPNDRVTRGQMAAFLARALGLP
jgi:Tol biopolymer transport system component